MDAIFEATAQIFDGQEDASTNHIAARAGISIGTLYQYFPNKTAILAAVAQREQERIVGRIKEALEQASGSDPEDTARTAIRALLTAFGGRQRFRRKLLLTLLPRFSHEFQRQVMEEVFESILGALQTLPPGEAPILDKTSGFVLTRALLGAVRSAIVEGSPALSDPALEDELVLLVVCYLRVGRGRSRAVHARLGS